MIRPRQSNSVFRTPSPTVLAALPERVAEFFRGVVMFPSARAALEVGGYDENEHREGLRLLMAVFEYPTLSAASSLDDEPARAAMAEIRRWMRRNFSRLRAGVERAHGPRNVVFAGIETPEPEREVLALVTLLERLKTLPTEHKAIDETLSRRGLDAEERAWLRMVIERARALGPVGSEPQKSGGREEQLIALYRWHSDWAGTARSLIRNKNVLAALGIARKKWRTDDTDASAEA